MSSDDNNSHGRYTVVIDLEEINTDDMIWLIDWCLMPTLAWLIWKTLWKQMSK
jgi:hypothetical protein